MSQLEQTQVSCVLYVNPDIRHWIVRFRIPKLLNIMDTVLSMELELCQTVPGLHRPHYLLTSQSLALALDLIDRDSKGRGEGLRK